MIKLTNRLSAVAQLVREDASLADVGCDHGYLPAYLIMNGKIKSAVACDINKGPLDSCIQLVADYSFEDKIKCVLSDGLCNIAENECDDIAICGMGGNIFNCDKSYYYLGNIKNFENKDYFNHLLNYLENKLKSGEDFSDVISAIKEKL